MTTELLFHVLLALAVVVVAGRVLGLVVGRIGQPPVIGEVLAGILLGPSLLGAIAPGVEDFLFPVSARPTLGIIAQIGVILYMFVVGLEFDPRSLRRRAAPYVVTSLASIAVPFALGWGLASLIHRALSPAGVPFVAFAMFMGVAMSITAFPVLARILTDRGLSRTELGTAALTCAAVDDVSAWCLLAVTVGVAKATLADAVVVLALTAAFIALMFFVARPIAVKLTADAEGELSHGAVTWTLAGLLISAVVAELIGIHAIFGAFLFGAIVPAGSALARRLQHDRTPVVTILFLPAFFAVTGLRTEIGLLGSWRDWGICLLIIALATAGKFGGTLIAARLTGMPRRLATRLGILLNTRGLMELVVLNVGLDLGVISPRLFTMMVIMALVTTAMTTPLLNLVPDSDDGTERATRTERAVEAASERACGGARGAKPLG